MREEFGDLTFPEYLWRRKRFLALTCVIATGLSGLAAALLPTKYTAISRIVIEPPTGMDPRASVAVSPVYLESLRSYEAYAASDELFARAVAHFGLRSGSEPIDSLKKSVLTVSMVRNTKILEIRVVLRDPRTAHRMARFLAEETVKLSQSVSRDAEEDAIREAEQQLAKARERSTAASAALAAAAQKGSVDQLKARMEADELLRSEFRLKAMLEEAEEPGKENARLTNFRNQIATLDKEIAARSKLLAELATSGSKLNAENAQAEAAVKLAGDRLDELRRAVNYRGDRLRLLDPGVVPERPSSPNTPLILIVGFVAGLALSLVVLAAEAGRARRRFAASRPDLMRHR